MKPVWQLQREMIDQQKSIAKKDLQFRKQLIKVREGKGGREGEREGERERGREGERERERVGEWENGKDGQ